MTPGARFRELLAEPGIVVAPGAYDAITARVIARHGFPAVYMTGAGTVNAHLGIPDIALGTLTEFVQNASRMTAVVDVPVICDADTGFGNALNVIRTVQEYERAGVAGIHIEDQESPKRCGHLDGKRIVPVEEMEGKIGAACDARSDSDFVIIARVDAAAVEGVEAAIQRAHRYIEAGADVIFAEALTTPDEFGRFGSAGVAAPLMANMTEFGKTPMLTARQFEDLGFAVVIFPMLAFRMMLGAVDGAMGELASVGTQEGMIDKMKTRAELYDLIDYDAWNQAEQRFVSD